ncbi:MAG: hypothetical protein RJQ04_02445 [Longimicrobiales bacterium]
MSRLALAEHQHDIIGALRRLDGTATVGDVVNATGMGADDARAGLKALLEERQGHLSVTETGDLLYRFDPRLIRRGSEPLLSRVRRKAWSVFQAAFKAWIVVMLVVYLVVFVVLILAAMFAGNRDGDSRGGWGGRRGGGHGHGHFPVPNFWLWYWIWGPRWRIGRPYYGHQWERSLHKEDKVPFYKKVFAFVFGPDRPEPSQRQLDRSTLRLIRARRGVLTAPELVEHTALPLPEAESEMGRLMASYDGEPVVSPGGEVAYAFPELMTTAHGTGTPREPNPTWLRLEYPRDLTGNTAGANAVVVGINAFNLLAAASAPWFIFPRLGLGGTAAWLFLVFVPVVFSLSFFLVPGLRMLGVKRENRRRAVRNIRRVVLGMVYDRAVDDRTVGVDEAFEHVKARLTEQPVSRSAVESALQSLAAEFDADVTPADDGSLRYAFPAVRTAFSEAEAVRRRLALEERRTGDVVFATDDTALEAGERELEAFDKELRGYVPSPDRVDYEADYEVVAFEEELGRRGLTPA